MSNHKIKFTLFRERPATQADLDAEAAYVAEHGRPNYGEDLKLGEPMDFEDEIELPARWEICDRCDGEGQHVNPNVDGHGISAEEWEQDWDEESREGYFRGDYDVPCEARCNGGKVLVVDEEACKNEPLKSLYEAYEKQEAERAQSEAEDRRTLYWESGGREGSRY